MIEPKVQDRPKIVLDLEEPEIKIGPRKLFSDWDLDWANRPKIVKSYNTSPKEFWAQGIKDTADRARNYKMDRLGINVINEAQYVIYFTSVVKLGKPKTSGPILFMFCDAI